jgi:hypothetical protein
MFIYKSFYPLLMGYIRKKNIKEITYNIVGRISIYGFFPISQLKYKAKTKLFSCKTLLGIYKLCLYDTHNYNVFTLPYTFICGKKIGYVFNSFTKNKRIL